MRHVRTSAISMTDSRASTLSLLFFDMETISPSKGAIRYCLSSCARAMRCSRESLDLDTFAASHSAFATLKFISFSQSCSALMEFEVSNNFFVASKSFSYASIFAFAETTLERSSAVIFVMRERSSSSVFMRFIKVSPLWTNSPSFTQMLSIFPDTVKPILACASGSVIPSKLAASAELAQKANTAVQKNSILNNLFIFCGA